LLLGWIDDIGDLSDQVAVFYATQKTTIASGQKRANNSKNNYQEYKTTGTSIFPALG
jgi:hypothetical protein